MKEKLKSAMEDMLQRNCICDYLLVQNAKEVYLKKECALDAYMKAYAMSMNGNVECYMAPDGKRACRPVFSVIDGIVRLSGLVIE